MVLMRDDSFFGGMNLEVPMPGQARLDFAIPTARLRVTDSKLRLSSPSANMAHLGRTRSVSIKRVDVDVVFRSTMRLHPGLGIETSEDKIHYFWTLHPQTVLDDLARRKYPLGPERKPLPYWTLLGFGGQNRTGYHQFPSGAPHHLGDTRGVSPTGTSAIPMRQT